MLSKLVPSVPSFYIRTKSRIKNGVTVVHLLQCKINFVIHLCFWGRNLRKLKNIHLGKPPLILILFLWIRLHPSTLVYTRPHSSRLVYSRLDSSSDTSVFLEQILTGFFLIICRSLEIKHSFKMWLNNNSWRETIADFSKTEVK